MRTAFLYLLVILAGYGLSGCSTPEKVRCASFDWFELGRRDGASGLKAEAFTRHLNQCTGEVTSEAKTLYRNGRKNGLIRYCTNGRRAGESGRAYYGVCPKNYEGSFLKEYRPGFRVFRIKSEKGQIQSQLQFGKLNLGQRDRLNKRLRSLDNELTALTSSNGPIRKASTN